MEKRPGVRNWTVASTIDNGGKEGGGRHVFSFLFLFSIPVKTGCNVKGRCNTVNTMHICQGRGRKPCVHYFDDLLAILRGRGGLPWNQVARKDYHIW